PSSTSSARGVVQRRSPGPLGPPRWRPGTRAACKQLLCTGGKAPHRMAKNILVISCDIAETRVALIENGIIAELHIERRGATPRGGTVGDIYLGRVTRVLPGLQAAFIDIGLERAAFLHVEDLIRPDDFEAYLAGGRKHALGTSEGAQGSAPDEGEVPAPAVIVGTETPAPFAREPSGEHAVLEAAGLTFGAGAGAIPSAAGSGATLGARAAAEEEAIEEAEEEEAELEDAAASADAMAVTSTRLDDPDSDPPPPPVPGDIDDLLDNPNLPGFTISDPGSPTPRAPAPRVDERRDGGRSGDKW